MFDRPVDVALLSFLPSAGQHDHKLFAIPPVLHTVSRAVVYTKLEHAGANRPMVAEVAQLHPIQASLDPRARLRSLPL